jgi:type II secretory pathway pseudopilin PulG
MPTGRPPRQTRRRRGAAAGFAYLGLLWMLAVTAAGLAVVGESWTQAARRERERELIFRGEQIRSAIDRYRRAIPTRSEWPKSLDELVEDRREDQTRHHLRRRFEDPFGPSAGWGEIRDVEGGLIGVHSRSSLRPLSRWPREGAHSAVARKLSDWRFVVVEATDTDTEATPEAAQAAAARVPAMGRPR